ncbi:MAG: phage tail family protein [Roseburia sp.]|nr:phage tail family protein [Roseburia sp.]MCM1097785.1 phage tail family protein [Ruminococcus flavefaciens]
MYIKIVRDDQRIFYLGGSYKDDASWGITEISGTDTIENVMTTVTPAVGDGDDITGERIPARNIDIFASVKNRRNNTAERRSALDFFNPKHSFTLYVTKGGVTRWCVAKLERFQCQEKAPDKHVAMNIAMRCQDPYFYSVDDYGKNIAAVTGCFGFPYVSPIGKGFRTGYYNFAKRVSIENDGDVETYVKIIVDATGRVKNPKILQNDVYIRLLDTLQEGDRLEIDMTKNTIRKNGANCIGKVDRLSSFTGMKLQPGDNEIAFDADDGDTNMKVFLYYNLRYLGV